MMQVFFVGFSLVLLSTLQFLSGVSATKYDINLWRGQTPTQQTLKLHRVRTCTLGFNSGWACGEEETRGHDGIVLKTSGKLVAFTRLTRWWHTRKAAFVMYRQQGVRMFVRKGQAIFQSLGAHSEAVFPLHCTVAFSLDFTSISLQIPFHLKYLAIDYDDATPTVIGSTRNTLAHTGVLVERRGTCSKGLAAFRDKEGILRWKVFGRMTRLGKAVFFICPKMGTELSHQEPYAVFSGYDDQATLPTRVFIDLRTPPEDIASQESMGRYIGYLPQQDIYLRYRPNGKPFAVTRYVKMELGAICALTRTNGAWGCGDSQTIHVNARGISVELGDDEEVAKVRKVKKVLQPHPRSAHIYPAGDVTLSVSRGLATFTSEDTTAVFPMGKVYDVAVSTSDDLARTVSAMKTIRGEYYNMVLHTDDGEDKDVAVTSASGIVGYNGEHWIFQDFEPTGQPPLKGIAIIDTFQSVAGTKWVFFKGARPLQATAAVYPAMGVRASFQRDKVYLTDDSTGVRVYVQLGPKGPAVENQEPLSDSEMLD